jgi:ABC-type transport system involved in multi-copper enzyme maturation permease subunit
VTWVAWRQHRTQAIAVAALLAVICGYMLAVGLRVNDFAERSGLLACLADGGDCSRAYVAMINRFDFFVGVTLFVGWLPMLIGAFWGAPLIAREVERGTHLLAWTQSVPRTRWLAVRLAVIVASVVVAMSLLSFVTGWLQQTYYGRTGGGSDANLTQLRDLIPPALALAVLGVGVAVGSLIRRTLPAMGVTLGIGFGLWLVVGRLSSLLVPPQRRIAPLGEMANIKAGETHAGAGWLDAAGNPSGFEDLARICPVNGEFTACAADHGYQSFVLYQPDDRYWTLQAVHAGILVAIGLTMLALAFWRLRRRTR